MNNELQVRGICLWRGDRRLCQGLSFGLGAGELLQLSGPNGAGKTSLLRTLAGIGRLDEGQVLWQGESVRGSASYREALIYIGHNNGLKNHLTSEENYIFYQSLAHHSSEVTAKVALERCGIAALKDRPVALLSMGQRRRAALARLLALKARLWLLDEPLASLDQDGIELVAGLLKEHIAAGGMGILVTHQPLSITGVAMRRLEMGEAA
ncbi:MAG TPA: cytochrome c biogenesis heme-transporting ATPase CcmA [Gammaproteobacteria bacterium]|jgi:heme exporter protein A